MKSYVLFLLMIAFTFNSVAQNTIDLEIGGNYLFIDTYPNMNIEGDKVSIHKSYTVYDPDQQGASNPNILSEAPIVKGYIVRIIDIDDGKVYFNYWRFEGPLKSKYNSGKIFSLSIEDFSRITTKRYDRWLGWRVKPFSVPIRLRGSGIDFEFETNLSLGTSIATGWNYNTRHDDRFVDLSIGVGITKVNLTPENSNLLGDTQSPTAFTLATGLVWHYKTVNAGLFLGWDYLSGSDQHQYQWGHNKKPWLGLGINIGLGNDRAKNDDNRDRLTNKEP